MALSRTGARLSLGGTGGVGNAILSGTTVERDATFTDPVRGNLWYNTDDMVLQIYTTVWQSTRVGILNTGSGGFYEDGDFTMDGFYDDGEIG